MPDYISMRLGTFQEIKNKPTNPLEQIMAEVVEYIAVKLNNGVKDPNTCIAEIDPKMLISMLTSNVVMNLFLMLIHRNPKLSSKSRGLMIKELADTIHFMILDCYRHLETQMGDGEIIN